MDEQANAQWATVELMGHARSAGRISRPSDWGGLLRVDVPDGDGYRTEYYGMPAIYSIKLVSEEIARAYVDQVIEARPYDAPIITREEHRQAIERAQTITRRLQLENEELQRRLTAVNALPAPKNKHPWIGAPGYFWDNDSPDKWEGILIAFDPGNRYSYIDEGGTQWENFTPPPPPDDASLPSEGDK